MILSCPSCGARFRTAAQTLGDSGRKVRCAKCKHVWRATPEEAQAEPGEPSPAHAIAANPDDTAPAGQAGESGSAGPADSDFGALAREALGARDQREEQGDGPPVLAPDPEQMAAHRQARRDALRRRAMETEPPRRGRGRGLLGWAVFLLVVGALLAGGWFGRYEIVARAPSASQLYAMAGVSVDPVAPGLELRNAERHRQLTDNGSVLVIEGNVVNVGGGTRAVPLLKVILFDSGGNELTAWTFAAEVSSLEGGETATFRTQIEDPPDAAHELSLTFTQSR